MADLAEALLYLGLAIARLLRAIELISGAD